MKRKIGYRAICAHCDLEIEFQGWRNWRDHGNNRQCVTYWDEIRGRVARRTVHTDVKRNPCKGATS